MKKIAIAFLVALLSFCSAAEAMTDSSIPTKIPTTWGTSAPGGNITCPMPIPSQMSITGGRASWTDGFPPLTFLPPGAGGIPPFGQDFNGVLCQISQWTRWYNAGAPIKYDSAFQTAVGGYPLGAVIPSASVVGCNWISTADNNASDPDTGGANWTNSCAVGGSLAGTLPNPTIAASGVSAGTYAPLTSVTFGADGRATAAVTHAPLGPTVYTSGTGSYSVPSGAIKLVIREVGGGGGGGGSGTGTSGGNGGNGAATSFNSVSANGGNGGAANNGLTGGLGGAVSGSGSGTASWRQQGTSGTAGQSFGTSSGVGYVGATGAGSAFGGGAGGSPAATAGSAAVASGSGGGAAPPNASGSVAGAGSGAAGEYLELTILSPTGPYNYSVGAAGTAGTAGTSGYAGGAGAAAIIIVQAYFN